MQLEERVASALRTHADLLPPKSHDLAVIRTSAKAQSRRRAAGIAGGLCAMVAVVAIASGVTGLAQDRAGDVRPGAPTTPSPSPSEAVEAIQAIDTTSWTTYRSARYDLRVGRPAGWTVDPSARRWRSDADSTDPLSPAHEAFEAPDGDVRVSVWSMPLDPALSVESTAFLVAWAEDYCAASGNAPCTGIGDRAVELCLEARDCHPGLLVPFESDVQAFFTGGIYDSEAMTVVAVWRPESDLSVRPYGGAQRLLEGFLSTMEVWPASAPPEQRR